MRWQFYRVEFHMYSYIAIGVVVLIALVVSARRYGSRIHLDGHTLRLAGLAVMLTGAGFFSLFVIGEIMADPGGGVGAFYIALFLTPLIALSVLAWSAPSISRYALTTATLAVMAFDVWTIITFDTWRTFEDDHGPLVTIAILIVEIPLAIHAYHRDTRVASLALIYLGIVPPILRAVAMGNFELSALQHLLMTSGFSPSLLVGALFLWSTFRPERITYPSIARHA